MFRLRRTDIDLEEALKNLDEFYEKGDGILPSAAGYLIGKRPIRRADIEVRTISALIGSTCQSFEVRPHYTWTSLGDKTYKKLCRYRSLPRFARQLYSLTL